MSLLSIVQSHCRINGLNYPTGVVASQDATVLQLWEILNELLDLVTDQSGFQGYTKESVFNLVVGEDQGLVSAIADAGFLWLHPGTFWDRDRHQPVYGPLTDTEWQQLKAFGVVGTLYNYRLWQDHLYVYPGPTGTGLSEVAFEYASSYGVKSAGGVAKQYFTVDTDVSILPEKILKRGLQYRWKEIKGLQYQSDEQTFWNLVNNQIARDKSPRPLSMAEPDCNMRPAIVVPLWNSVP